MSEPLIVDASVAVKWFVVEAGSDLAERLLDSPGQLHAPNLLRSEVANALWSNCRKNTIGRTQATESLASLDRTIGRWHDTDSLLRQAFAWSLAYDHPVYGFCYLALAQATGASLVTADARFLRAIAGMPEASFVRALKDIA